MHKLLPYALVGLGGFVGANARYLLGAWVGTQLGTRFPLGTFIINVSGAFVLGVVGTLVAERLIRSPEEVRLLVSIGFLGAYTTFSTFSFESYALIEDGEWARALANLVLSPAIGLVAVHLGVLMARRLG